MNFKELLPDTTISLFVKKVFVIEEEKQVGKSVLPFYADGFPGLMFQETKHGLFVSPHNKKMPELFLYGQTIVPIELMIDGPFRLIVFQFYPFVLKSLFGLNAKDLNDDCYDLQSKEKDTVLLLNKTKSESQRIEILTKKLFDIFENRKSAFDHGVIQAIKVILEHKGLLPIKEVSERVHSTVRTFERKFIAEVGLSPKQFSKIIQFQESFEQLTSRDFSELSDVVYENGFVDQSHFIKVFKAFTGKTPKAFK